MPYGLHKLTQIVQTSEAWKDWEKLSIQACRDGHAEIVYRLKPPDGASWRIVDKRISELRQALKKLEEG